MVVGGLLAVGLDLQTRGRETLGFVRRILPEAAGLFRAVNKTISGFAFRFGQNSLLAELSDGIVRRFYAPGARNRVLVSVSWRPPEKMPMRTWLLISGRTVRGNSAK